MTSNRSLFQALAAVAAAFLAYTYYMYFGLWDNSLPYKIAKVSGRGKGLVATRDIMQGELIIKEEPLFIIKRGTFGDNLGEYVTKYVHQALNSTQRSDFLDLSHPLKAGHEAIPEAIFQINSLKTSGGSGIFLKMARINHGCAGSFNSVYSWRDKEGYGVIHALKPIRKGQEILREYADTKSPKDFRQKHLSEIYAFDCSCSTCSKSSEDGDRSDAALSSMATILEEFSKWEDDTEMDGAETVRLAKRVWALGEKEGYWAERGKLADDVVKVAAAHQDEKAVRSWAELASEWYSYELGHDSEEVARMLEMASDPSSHSGWATRKEARVGGPDMILI